MFEQEESKQAKRDRIAKEMAAFQAKGGQTQTANFRTKEDAENERRGDMAWEAKCRQALEPSW